MRSVSNWLKRNWIAVVAIISLCMSTVVAAPSVFNGSLVVPVSGTVTDNNAANGTVPIVNSSHVYAYVTPNPTASNACLTVTTPVNALSPVIGIANSNILATGCGGNGTGVPSLSAGTGLTSSGSWAAQTIGLAAIAPYSINVNNSNATATPIPISAAALAGMLSGSNGCPPQVFMATGTSTDTSGTYTTPMCNGVTATILWVRAVGGGGGANGFNNSCTAAGAATAGDASSFGTFSAGGGGAALSVNGGSGGTVSGSPQFGVQGFNGVSGISANYSAGSNGGVGGNSVWGQGGQGGGSEIGLSGSTGNGYGSGGGGASCAVAANASQGGGGGGAYFETFILSPSATYSYTAGKYGAGVAGTTSTGGSGAPGRVIVVATWGTL